MYKSALFALYFKFEKEITSWHKSKNFPHFRQYLTEIVA